MSRWARASLDASSIDHTRPSRAVGHTSTSERYPPHEDWELQASSMASTRRASVRDHLGQRRELVDVALVEDDARACHQPSTFRMRNVTPASGFVHGPKVKSETSPSTR